jgi:hypothetical protein
LLGRDYLKDMASDLISTALESAISGIKQELGRIK